MMESPQMRQPHEQVPATGPSFGSGVNVGFSDKKEVLSKAEQIYFETYLGVKCRAGEIDERSLEKSPINFKAFEEPLEELLDKEEHSFPRGGVDREQAKGSYSEGKERREGRFPEESIIDVSSASSDNIEELPNLSFLSENYNFETLQVEFLSSISSCEEENKGYSCYCSEIDSLNNFDFESTEILPEQAICQKEMRPESGQNQKQSKRCEGGNTRPHFISTLAALILSLSPRIRNGIPYAEEAGKKIQLPSNQRPISIKEELEAAIVERPSYSSSPFLRHVPISCFEKILHHWMKVNSTEEIFRNSEALNNIHNGSRNREPSQIVNLSGHLCSGIEELSNMAEQLKIMRYKQKK